MIFKTHTFQCSTTRPVDVKYEQLEIIACHDTTFEVSDFLALITRRLRLTIKAKVFGYFSLFIGRLIVFIISVRLLKIGTKSKHNIFVWSKYNDTCWTNLYCCIIFFNICVCFVSCYKILLKLTSLLLRFDLLSVILEISLLFFSVYT